jgi:polygalacturonase
MKRTSGAVLLMAACLAVPAWAQRPFFNVLDFGAKNDASAPATEAINSAIQACAKAGGGTVYIPAGDYVSGHIELVSNLVLRIDAGATIRFLVDYKEYPIIRGRYEGIETYVPSALIGGRNLHDVTITGRGTLSADNAAWMKLANKPDLRRQWASILERLDNKQTVPDEEFRQTAYALRPSFIEPVESKNVLIEGIHVVGSSFWVIHLLYCDNVVVRNVMIETNPGANTDGVDIDSSRDIRISDSYFDTGDDAIVIKSGKNADGLRVNRITENLAITNCTVHHGHGAVVLGSETSGGIRNVVASNIVAHGTDRGIRIKSGRGRGGLLENIRFDNWVIEDTPMPAIEITNYYTRVPRQPVSETTPVFRNFAISNVTVNRCRTAVSIEGLPEMPVENLRLTDVIASATEGLRAFNTKGLELHNVRVNPESGIPFLIRDSSDLDLDGVQTRAPQKGVPVVRLDRCERVWLRNSIAWPGTDIFLSTAPGAMGQVVQAGNVLGAAATPSKEAEEDYWKSIRTPDQPMGPRRRR